MNPLPDPVALTTLLTVQGLGVAALALVLNVVRSQQEQPLELPVDALILVRIVSAGIVVVGVGALVAWCLVYVGGSFIGLARATVAVCILLAVLLQIALGALVLGTKR